MFVGNKKVKVFFGVMINNGLLMLANGYSRLPRWLVKALYAGTDLSINAADKMPLLHKEPRLHLCVRIGAQEKAVGEISDEFAHVYLGQPTGRDARCAVERTR